jgi:hypothetical protein
LNLNDPEMEIGGWEVLMWYDSTAGTVVGVDQYACGVDSLWAHDPEMADPGGWSWIQPLFTEGLYGPQYFNYVLGADDHANWVRVVGLMNTDSSQVHTPGIQGADNGILFSLIVDVAEDTDGQKMLLGWEVVNCTDNTFTNSEGSVLWGPREESRPPELECPYHGWTDVVELYDYPHGSPGFSICDTELGDINCDGMAHSVADAVMFVNYLLHGDIALRGPSGHYYCGSFESHCQAADIDQDGECFTTVDLVRLIRIINGYGFEKILTGRGGSDELVVSVSNGKVSVDRSVGAARFVFAGEAEVSGEDVAFTHRDGRTLVLAYTLEDRALRGELFTIAGDVRLESAEAADSYGSPLTVKTPKTPNRFSLIQNYPNPFNPHTEIRYFLSEACRAKLEVFNVLGQQIRTLVDEYQTAGLNSVTWDGRDEWGDEVSAGVYFYRLSAEGFSATKKMVLLK